MEKSKLCPRGRPSQNGSLQGMNCKDPVNGERALLCSEEMEEQEEAHNRLLQTVGWSLIRCSLAARPCSKSMFHVEATTSYRGHARDGDKNDSLASLP